MTANALASPASPPARWAREASLELLQWTARGVENLPPARRAFFRALQRRVREAPLPDPGFARQPPAVEADKRAMKLALLRVAETALAEHRLSRASLRGLLKLLLVDVFVRRGDQRAKDRFRASHGCGPPDFLVLSPGKACNLACIGCYANAGPTREKLDWVTVDHIVRDAHDSWGTRFFVVSGGEPLAWRSEGKGVLDLAERHADCFFLMYSNGTLIDDRLACRLGELGNIIPGLSVEGLRERTDARRGTGVFDKVLGAMERLRREGVLFGLSLTATRDNAEEVLSDELVELFFEKMGACHAWIFHYMPIGRAFSLGLMMTPEQRARLWRRVWYLVRERGLFLADFWNSGTASNGCLAGGRPGGYFYVDWNGAVSPCVFMPYSPVNIKDVYARGGTLDDVWAEPFFAAIRCWQRGYGYRENGEGTAEFGNWLRPCLIRDHYAELRPLLEEYRPAPADEDARAALADPEYARGLKAFGRELAALMDPVWDAEYLSAPSPSAPVGARWEPLRWGPRPRNG
jgi:MoaA/NifB/PqqE/SkfB family radical SAM enzyme